jgi:glyoxylase I family protein
MQITGTHHIALLTDNFERMRAFYTDVLGLPVIGGFPGRDIIFLGAGDTAIELVSRKERPGAGGGWDHLALQVADTDAAYAELSARGVPFHDPPRSFPPDAPSTRIAFFKDPDGNLLELFQPLGQRYPTKSE